MLAKDRKQRPSIAQVVVRLEQLLEAETGAASDVEPAGATQPSFLVKALTHGPFKPLPYPNGPVTAPSTSGPGQ